MLNLTKGEEVIRSVPEGAQFSLPNGDVVSPAYAGWSNGEYALVEAPPAPEPVVDPNAARRGMSLSFAQLMIGLVTEGWISEADGVQWLAGTLPPSVEATIALIPADQRFAARARATRPSIVERLDPLVQMMAMAQGRSDQEVDDFFVKYAAV